MKIKYPSISPYRTGYLEVDSPHRLYYEESGSPLGIPVLFLHGGPGSGTDPSHRCYFDPSRYRIILMDQRGCGKSTPHACLEKNTTWDLVKDINTLRQHLKVKKWVVFGGSWGSTLALSYAECFPNDILALVLRGIFLGRPQDLKWFYQFGAHHIFPDEWEKFLEPINIDEREDLILAYYKRLTSEDPKIRMKAASAWSKWEGATLKLVLDPSFFKQFTQDHHADALARIECHYFIHKCFFKTDNFLIENIEKIRHIPAKIIHGRYDVVCPMDCAWQLHKSWPEADFEIIKDAGHAASEPGITDALIRATDHFASVLQVE